MTAEPVTSPTHFRPLNERSATLFDLKNVTGFLALAASVFTTLGFVSRFLSFQWSPNSSIRRSAIALTTMASPIDWLAIGVTTSLLPCVPVIGSMLAGVFMGKRLPRHLAFATTSSNWGVWSERAYYAIGVFLLLFVLDFRFLFALGFPFLVVLLVLRKRLSVDTSAADLVEPLVGMFVVTFVWLALIGGLRSPVSAQREQLTVGKSQSVVLVVADNSNFLSYLPCGGKAKNLTTISRSSVLRRTVLPLQTKRSYPTVWKLITRGFYVDGLDVGVRTSC